MCEPASGSAACLRVVVRDYECPVSYFIGYFTIQTIWLIELIVRNELVYVCILRDVILANRSRIVFVKVLLDDDARAIPTSLPPFTVIKVGR